MLNKENETRSIVSNLLCLVNKSDTDKTKVVKDFIYLFIY